jgi:hypothetical protein
VGEQQEKFFPLLGKHKLLRENAVVIVAVFPFSLTVALLLASSCSCDASDEFLRYEAMCYTCDDAY